MDSLVENIYNIRIQALHNVIKYRLHCSLFGPRIKITPEAFRVE